MKSPKTRTENIVVQNVEKEILIYDLDTHQAFNLNETASLVYQACDGVNSFEDLKRKHKFTDDLIYLSLDELKKAKLIVDAAVSEGGASSYVSPFAGMTRRDAIRKVGLASMIALPVISSLVAPTASAAQSAASGFAPGSRTLRQTCNTSSDCASGSPNCTVTPLGSSQRICCVGSISYYDTGGVVNSCSGGPCSSATFACQSNAGNFCCSGSATASCTGNSCACRCD